MWLIILQLAFAVPASAGAGDQLCEATGQGSGCLGTITPTGGSDYQRRERPECDAACRQQAEEAYEYAASHIEEPQDLAGPGADDIREKRTLASAVKDDAGRDVQLAGAALLVVGAPVEAPFWLVGLGVFGTAMVLVEPHAHLERYVPAIWNSLVSLSHAQDRLSRAEQTAQPTEHERELGTDLDSGQFRPSEAEAAKRLEKTVGPLKRDPSKTGDWVDQNGKTYDAVGPAPSEHFDPESFNGQIDRHLRKQGLDVVVVDVEGLSPEQEGQVRKHVGDLPLSEQGRVIVQGTPR